MLKKAGIVVAAAAAGLLAVSPLAFAGDDKGYYGEGNSSVESFEDNSEEIFEDNDKANVDSGLVNVTGNNTSIPVNACDIQVPVNVLGVQVPVNDTNAIADVSGALGLGLLGDGDARSSRDGDTALSDDCTAVSDIDSVDSTKVSG